jgi:hypothetical protein
LRHFQPSQAKPSQAKPSQAKPSQALIRKIKWILALSVLMALYETSAEAQNLRAWEVVAPSFYVREFTLNASAAVVFSTQPVKVGVNEVLHLLVEGPAGVWTQVAGESTAPFTYSHPHTSYLAYQNTSTKQKNYRLIIRAASFTTQGEVTLRENGLPVGFPATEFPAGGFVFSDTWLADATNGSIHAVPTPGGSKWPAIVSLNASGVITQLGMTGGAGGATRINSLTTDKVYFVGTPSFQIKGQPLDSPRDGEAMIYVNDGGDKDSDGLGDLLEQTLGLCWDNVSCPNAATAKDTDRDGLPDFEEVLGVIGIANDPDDDFALPRWGADPLQKDVFLVMNWRTDLSVPINPSINPFIQAMPWVDDLRSAYLEAPAHQVYNKRINPSTNQLVNGISVHVDLRIDPTNPADEAKFGRWSPDIIHGINPPWILKFKGPVEGVVSVVVNGNGSFIQSTGLNTDELATAFELAAISVASFSSTPIKRKSKETDSNGVVTLVLDIADTHIGGYFSRSATVPNGFQDQIEQIDQDNKLLGSYINDEKYMPYSISDRVKMGVVIRRGGQAQGAPGRTFVSLISHLTVGHELGHSLGLEHWGHNTWLNHTDGGGITNDIRYFPYTGHPNYPSLMNYGFSLYHFSALENMIKINPARSPEVGGFTDAFGQTGFINASLYTGYPFYRHILGSVGVDWNLNGDIESGILFNAPIRMSKGRDVNAFNVGEQKIADASTNIVGAMDIVKANDYIYAFYSLDSQGVGTGTIHYRRALIGPQINSSCTGPDNVLYYDALDRDDSNAGNDTGGCLYWLEDLNLSVSSKGLSAFWWDNRLFIASWQADNSLIVYRYTIGGNGLLILQGSQNVVNTTGHRGKPELSVLYANPVAGHSWSERLVVVSNDTSTQRYEFYYWNGTSFVAWTSINNAFSAANSLPPGLPSGPHKLQGWGDATLAPWPDPYNIEFKNVRIQDRVTCGIFPSFAPDRILRPYCLNPNTLEWLDVLNEAMPNWSTDPSDPSKLLRSETPPELAFRYLRRATGAPLSTIDANGNYQLTYTSRPLGSPVTQVFISSAVSAVNHPYSGSQPWAFEDWTMTYANVWRDIEPGTNAPMYEDHTMGSMFAISTRRFENFTRIYFQPHADGTPNIDFWAGSDFKVMEDLICYRKTSSTNQNLIGIDCGPVNINLNTLQP